MEGWRVFEAWGGGFGRARRVGREDTEAGGLSINSRFGIVEGDTKIVVISSSVLEGIVLGFMIGSNVAG